MSVPRKPPRLGMGLSALIGDAPPAEADRPGAAGPATSGGQRTLPIESLEPGPFQPRGPVEPEALAELAASIREHGVLQPILVRPKPGTAGTYQIIGGERRWRAAQAAGLHEVPVTIRDLGDREAMAAALVENLQRQDLNALEEAEGYSRLIEEFGLTQDALGKAVGKSRSHIANTLRLLGLPATVREMLRKGQLTAGHARAILVARDPEKLAAAVVARGLSVRQTEALAAAKPRQPAEAGGAGDRRQERDPDIARLEQDLTERLGLRVTIQARSRGGGQLTIAYRTLDQLDGLIRLLDPEAR
ncbi:ParB/RepB/Spo0J family partition protein [Caldovatus aquaticus]|uniref:ParB/RepB/Spo0J family partition protein n=1 Tax=Caldovatus aquaticus TaxID=2865671 RepID=A0ABS7F4B2_9PROT|nr:ParB/RepB/Spo0J family partition protein [Caldovatus aquaticus]MBW8270455.1 ParB/RepB/Spo0J family partition protein [Caldovatus aquaticus]